MREATTGGRLGRNGGGFGASSVARPRFAGARWAPDSSARIPSSGKRSRIAPRMRSSHRWSTSVTTSLADLWSIRSTRSYRSRWIRPAASAISRANAASAARLPPRASAEPAAAGVGRQDRRASPRGSRPAVRGQRLGLRPEARDHRVEANRRSRLDDRALHEHRVGPMPGSAGSSIRQVVLPAREPALVTEIVTRRPAGSAATAATVPLNGPMPLTRKWATMAIPMTGDPDPGEHRAVRLRRGRPLEPERVAPLAHALADRDLRAAPHAAMRGLGGPGGVGRSA